MPELRKDPITGRWVIIAAERVENAHRLASFGSDHRRVLPFCYGEREHTPPEILSLSHRRCASNSPGWMLRVVPISSGIGYRGRAQSAGRGLFDKMNGIGAHEVIIETPDHMLLSPRSASRPWRMFSGLSAIGCLISRKTGAFAILIFKNHGEAAGASRNIHTRS